MGFLEHKIRAPKSVRIGVLSISTTRSIDNDESGSWIVKRARIYGHSVVIYEILRDNIKKIRNRVVEIVKGDILDALLLTGGTGMSKKDVTIEAVAPLFSKKMPAFDAMFAQLSYEEIGSSAILSRASAGIFEKTIIFCMPGSRKACELACKSLIFPELGHIVSHVV